jgi:hypothetical protein
LFCIFFFFSKQIKSAICFFYWFFHTEVIVSNGEIMQCIWRLVFLCESSLIHRKINHCIYFFFAKSCVYELMVDFSLRFRVSKEELMHFFFFLSLAKSLCSVHYNWVFFFFFFNAPFFFTLNAYFWGPFFARGLSDRLSRLMEEPVL